MGANVSALLYAMLGVLTPALLLPFGSVVKLFLRTYAVWLMLLTVLLLVGDQALTLILAFILVMLLTPTKPASRAAAFMVLVCAVPDYVSAPLPFPGINYLVELNHYKICVIAALLPLLFTADRGRIGTPGAIAVALLVVFSLYTALMTGLSTTFTGGVRMLVENLLTLVLPALALQLAIRSREDFDEVCKGVLLASVVLGCIALVTTAKQWEFYRMHEPISLLSIADFRTGFLRVRATANTHSLGFHMITGLLMLEILKRPLELDWKRLAVLRFILIVGLVTTDSRGSMVGGTIALAVAVFLAIRSAGLKAAILGLAGCAAIFGAFWLITSDTTLFDPHGTIRYRQLLIQTSLKFVLENPIFGDVDYLATGLFNHLIQGQQIVDVTNLYLQIALPFGLLGCLIFFGAFFTSVLALLGGCRVFPTSSDEQLSHLFRAQCLLLGGSVGWLAFVATTSNVALTVHLCILFMALGQAAVRIYRGIEQPKIVRWRPALPIVGTKYVTSRQPI
jgi:hypothetical protein